MKIIKTIYIVQCKDYSDLTVYTSKEEAVTAIEDEINYYAEKWGNEDEAIVTAREELQDSLTRADRSGYFGTYILDNSISCHIETVEFDVDIDLTKGV